MFVSNQYLLISLTILFIVISGNTLYDLNSAKLGFAQQSKNYNNKSMSNDNGNINVTSNIKTIENGKLENNNIKIIATGDWGCNEQSESTINEINNKKPDIVISLGDMSYREKGDCFYELISPIKNKTKIVFGNHDIQFGENKVLKDEYLKNFNLSKSFYSFDLENIHFVLLESTISPSKLSDQYNFVKNDLKNNAKNNSTNWTIVALHKPLYTVPGKHEPDIAYANTYHKLFDYYNVDLILAGHNHWYERTLPLKYNKINQTEPIINILGISEEMYNKINGSLIDIEINSTFFNPKNPIFITAGTAGKENYIQEKMLPFTTSIYDNGYGFLEMNVSKYHIEGKFYANKIDQNQTVLEGFEIRDNFLIIKSS